MVDGLTRRRLDKPWLRRDGKLVAASWAEALPLSADQSGRFGGRGRGRSGRLRNDVCRQEAAGALGSTLLEGRQTGMAYAVDTWLPCFNSTLAGIETLTRS
jgi:NADH-quinone oxidoreductase subunit G